MRIKLTLERPGRTRTDIVVTTDPSTTIGDLARELLELDPARPTIPEYPITIAVAQRGHDAFEQLRPERSVGESPLLSGSVARIDPLSTSAGGDRMTPRVSVTIGTGSQAKTATFPSGAFVVGRDRKCEILLDDGMASRRHARLDVGATIELVDLKSANGIEVDGFTVTRVPITATQVVTIGKTRLKIEPLSTSAGTRPIADAPAIPFNRSPRVEPRYSGRELPAPDVPGEGDKPPFPWLMMLVPLLMGGVAFMVTSGSPGARIPSLVMMGMSPVMMAANYMMGLQRAGKQRDSAIGRFAEQMAGLRTDFAAEELAERSARLSEAPSAAEVLTAVEHGGTLMWTRRPEHWTFLNVRFGIGEARSRTRLAHRNNGSRGIPRFAEQVDRLVAERTYITGVPIIENPIEAGALGIVADRLAAHAVARSLLVQWAGLHSPAEVNICAMVSSDDSSDVDWLKWLPHTSSPSSPLSGPVLADNSAASAVLLSQLEELVSSRLDRASKSAIAHRPSLGGEPTTMVAGGSVGENKTGPTSVPVVILFVTHSAVVDRARLAHLAERAADAGVFVLHLANSVDQLPAVCRTYVDLTGPSGAAVHYVRHGHSVDNVSIETVTPSEAEQMALRMAPFFDQSALVVDSSDLPQSVPLLSLLGADAAGSAAAIAGRWHETESLHENPPRPRRRASGLRAMVGSTGASPLHLDLRLQGPHALVGGTTGAGKSEFLQAWVLGMAAEYSPQRVTFLFVDYKGGAAFAECVDLPHCVGLVTDLSPHLVLRALTSLRAELRYREHLLNGKQAKDLIELEKRGDPDCPPALVIVIDEFAALAKEVPDFVDGVVDVAQRGRSLGIHLIMATQRPAGVIKDNLRANTNLRIALRMADESDSRDVVDSTIAATFDPGKPGRGVAKTGPGRLTPFQSGFAGARSNAAAVKPGIAVATLRFGAEQAWEPRGEKESDVPAPAGPTDLVALVESIREASRLESLTPPRRPWLKELRNTYDVVTLGPRTDTHLMIGMADLPDTQQQQPVAFQPDTDGHLVVYGTGGSGKTVLLRTLAAVAGITPRGGPIDVYAMDFASGGLRMLEPLPHVGAVIAADDEDRVSRLMRTLRTELERRKTAFSAVNADSIVAYRTLAGKPEEARIVVILDGYPTFRTEYEGVGNRAQAYATFQQLLVEGRQLGMHVVMTADRPASVPGSISSNIPRRIALRLAEDTMYAAMDLPSDVLSATSPPGRGIIDGLEFQTAVLGGVGDAGTQTAAVAALTDGLVRSGRQRAAEVAVLPVEIAATTMPDAVGGQPVLGVSDTTLEPLGFNPEGVLLVAGPPGAGRTNALQVIHRSLMRWRPDIPMYLLSGRRTPLSDASKWTSVAIGPDDVAALAPRIAEQLIARDPGVEPVVVIIEAIGDLSGTSADSALTELVKVAKRSGHLLIAENETSGWTGGWGAAALNEIKAGRRGLILQPDQMDGDALLRTPFPRIGRDEFPPGRALFVERGKTTKVQLPFLDG